MGAFLRFRLPGRTCHGEMNNTVHVSLNSPHSRPLTHFVPPTFFFFCFPSLFRSLLHSQVRKWRQEINAQQRALDRQKRGIETEEAKVKRTIKQIAKKGDIKTCKMLAKELVRSRRQKDRIVTSKAQLNSISMQLQHQLCKFCQ